MRNFKLTILVLMLLSALDPAALPAASLGLTVNPAAAAHAVRHPVRWFHATPESPTRRRVLGAIAAGLNVADDITTHAALCSPAYQFGRCTPNGLAHELNPLFAVNGALQARRFDLVKLGITAGLLGGEELPRALHFHHLDTWERTFTVINIVGAVEFGVVTANNLRIISVTQSR